MCVKAGGEQVCPTDINSEWWGNKAFLREEADDILHFVSQVTFRVIQH